MLIFKIISKRRLNSVVLTYRLYLKIVIALIRTKTINNLVEHLNLKKTMGKKMANGPGDLTM